MSTEVAGREAAARPDPAKDQPRSSRFGLPTATALVVGSVIGTGVFGLPTALAPFGPISLVAFVLVTIGALALALTFGALAKRISGVSPASVHCHWLCQMFVLL